MMHSPEKFRVKGTAAMGPNGMYLIPAAGNRPNLGIVSSDSVGWEEAKLPLPAWEHVSVSTRTRCPTWPEMCLVKRLFWDEEDWVLQFHPAASAYINNHPYVLHLWRPLRVDVPKPPDITVGSNDPLVVAKMKAEWAEFMKRRM